MYIHWGNVHPLIQHIQKSGLCYSVNQYPTYLLWYLILIYMIVLDSKLSVRLTDASVKTSHCSTSPSTESWSLMPLWGILLRALPNKPLALKSPSQSLFPGNPTKYLKGVFEGLEISRITKQAEGWKSRFSALMYFLITD